MSGHLRIGAIPTALPVVPLLLARFAERYPHIRTSVVSLSSREIQRDLDAFELDAAVTYLDNEPLNNVRTAPLVSERYYLLAPRSSLPEGTASLRWADAADVMPLCLLTPDMQNRRIADAAFRMADRKVTPLVETNSIVTLYTIARSGLGASVVPSQLLTLVAPHPDVVALPLVEPDLTYAVGLVYAAREPVAPLTKALAAVAGEKGLGERIRALTEDALAPWRR